MKDEIQLDTYYLKARALTKRIEDMSYTLSRLEARYPSHSLTPEAKKWLIKTYFGYGEELKDLIKDFEELKKEYDNE